ncbi:hypothetical protein MRX96_051939 [Rhipicephalus microplus]
MSTSANSLAPGNPTMSATGSGRVKVSLGPGRSLMDWIRLTHANPNLSGVNGRFLEVTYEELMKHNKKDDAWICLKGRGVGKDATDLFNQVHKWVNFESMLEKCLIGKVVGPAVQVRKSSFPVPRIPFIKKLQWTDTATSEDVPDISEGTSPKPAVSYEWFQDDSTVTITIQSMGDAIIEEDKVVADLSGKTLRIRLRLSKYFYFFHVELQDNVYSSYNVQVKCKLKCLEIQLVKEKNCVSWSSLGSFLADHNKLVPLKNAESFSRSCTLVNKDSVTHDTTLFTFALPQGSYMWVPIGHHVTLEHDVKGMRISRSYTPIYPDGALTPLLKALEIGDKVDMKDTEGDFELSTLQSCQNLVLLAAGTGFTPMVRLLHWGDLCLQAN